MKTLFLLTAILFSSLLYAQEVELSDLMFSENWFSNLEEAQQHPDKVLYLDLSLQKRKIFPEVIFTFKNLERLYAPVNYWASIPDEIGTLDKLKVLDLSSNYYLNHLPEGLAKLKSLEEFVIKDNKLAKGEIEKFRKWLPDCKVVVD